MTDLRARDTKCDLAPPDSNQCTNEAGCELPGQTSTQFVDSSVPQPPHHQPPLPLGKLDAKRASTSAATVTQQPYSPYTHPSASTKPDDYFYFSLVVTICCCFIFGIVALICSRRSKDLYDQRDNVGAKSASKAALVLNILGIASGIIVVIVVLCIGFISYGTTINQLCRQFMR